MRQSLNGTWALRTPKGSWGEVQVPGCWEDEGHPKDHPGPYIYQRTVDIPESLGGDRVWLKFEGVSYHAQIFLNEVEIGTHTGAWDAFEFDITEHVTPGHAATLSVHVEKPASLEQGPASEAVPGNFPLKETLAGFLPYVWGHLFGGLWQDVWLETRTIPVVEDIFIRGGADGKFEAEVQLSADAEYELEIVAPGDEVVARAKGQNNVETLVGKVADVEPWCPRTPHLYEARVRLGEDIIYTSRFGFRDFETRGTLLYLNDRPLYPRMALSWGWYQDSLHSNPGPEQVRADLLRLKALGYNGVKLCLWVPPRYYFELADELGMLLWLELPMWLPKATPFFKQQTPQEYERILRQVRQHPSLIIYSLGCELNREVGDEILEPLYHLAKDLVGESLIRDNSGSGEAYGGLLNEFADYYDYHFYSDIQFFANLVDYFTPRWRPVQPWVFGEFCDLDTFRDLKTLLLEERDGHLWWVSADPAKNPQGARWQYDVPFLEERLRKNGFWERGKELEAVSNKQALLHRKFTLELVRTYREISGYVITGERDTPISTAGMWNDLGKDKFDPASFRAFNDDLTLSLGWDKRRAWINGGDRAGYWDTFCYTPGAKVRPHLVASNYSEVEKVQLTWRALAANKEIDSSRTIVEILPGDVREVEVAEFLMPEVEQPTLVTLEASLEAEKARTSNTWNLWCFPTELWHGVSKVSLFDPDRYMQGIEKVAGARVTATLTGTVIATSWSRELEEFVRGGGRGVLLLTGHQDDPFPTEPLPFWREAVKLLEPHPAWNDFPHDGFTDLQFYGMATDLALDTSGLSKLRPILRRVDARTAAVHDYAAEIPFGEGRLIATTLKFWGGLGNQPLGVERNTAAVYLLGCFVRYLQAF